MTHTGSNLRYSIGVTVDFDKEKANFRKAGETLAEIWSEMTIDDLQVSI